MPRKSRSGLVFRKLWPSERDKVRDHFLRLDPEDRHLRFIRQPRWCITGCSVIAHF